MDGTTGKTKIGVGARVGMLTVVEATDQRRNGYTVWRCRCDCGGERLLDTRCLQRGAVRDCGCGRQLPANQLNLTGRRFGKLTCLEPTQARGPSGVVVWKCRCDCGNECTAVSTQLTSGYKKSCGCLSRQEIRDDFVGRSFGELTVTEYAGRRNGRHYWRCRCRCGREAVVGQTNLQSGHTRSCGCLQQACRKRPLAFSDKRERAEDPS